MGQADAVTVHALSKSFTNQNTTDRVLDNISFRVKEGEILTILGQSGCGKSTILNMIGGFEKPDAGSVTIGDKVVDEPNRQCVKLFQNYGLLPWRSVLKNVELGLEDGSLSKVERRERALKYVKLVGLEERINSFPHQLSGGMQQRVALARALALQPDLILMDEPFAALDTFTRYYLQNELLQIQAQEQTTIVLVTHDIDEAVYLSDRVLMMSANPGKIHKEIIIPLSKPRDRASDDFQHFRKLILEHFHFDGPDKTIEYSI